MDTEKVNPSPGQLSSGRLQDKADILENNLSNSISKQNDKVKINFQINRTQYPNSVIIKALLQLFPLINIKGSKIILILKKLLARTIPEDEELKIKKQLLDLSETDNPDLTRLSLTLEILITSKLLSMGIKGTHAIPNRDGAIVKAYFDHKACPGLMLKNGVIDFREINKYPIVKAGDNLFFISREFQGKPGMAYDGNIIQVPKALPLDVNLKDGVDLVDGLDNKGTTRGYFLRANKTGVVLLTRSKDKITEIEINDKLNVKRLDYSTGNIGTKYICPVSMKIDTICNGFKIRARGMVEVNVLEGGEIITDNQAIIQTIQTDSKVTAKGNIILGLARNSILTSEKGYITIKEELIESTLFSVGISFEKSRGILTSNILDAEILSLDNIYFCGENKIYFGCRLFSQKNALNESLEILQKEVIAGKEKAKELMENLNHELQRLSKTIKTKPMVQNNFKQLILATRTMDFAILYKELEAISAQMNTKEVTAIQKLLDTLSQIPKKNKSRIEQEEDINKKIREIDQKMSKMNLSIQGYLRRAATLKIFTGAPEKDIPQKPELFIESEKDQDTFIKIQGRYNLYKGFTITRE